jgi:hypothetical protein
MGYYHIKLTPNASRLCTVGPSDSIITNKKIHVYEYFGSMADLHRPQKRHKIENLFSLTIGYLETSKGSKKSKDLKKIPGIVMWMKLILNSVIMI